MEYTKLRKVISDWYKDIEVKEMLNERIWNEAQKESKDKIRTSLFKIQLDISILIEICEQLEKKYGFEEWQPSEAQIIQLETITDLEDRQWDQEGLTLYISGMQRASHRIEKYIKEDYGA